MKLVITAMDKGGILVTREILVYFKSRTWRGLLTNIEKWGRLWAVCGRKGSPALGTKGFALASGAGDLGTEPAHGMSNGNSELALSAWKWGEGHACHKEESRTRFYNFQRSHVYCTAAFKISDRNAAPIGSKLLTTLL